MIISRTPYRISFFGGGTDFPAWYRAEGGAVLSTSIDKYCYISCRYLPPFFSNKHRIVWSHIETVSTISEILHPAVRESLRLLSFDDATGLEIHHQGDLPARSGMGSSSSFAVGLLHSLSALRKQRFSKHELALKAIELEQQALRDTVGSQDQVIAAHGGFNIIRFQRNGSITVDPIALPAMRLLDLESHLLLFYTGTSRLSSEIAKTMLANLRSKEEILRRMHGMVDEAVAILRQSGSLDSFGELLHEAWTLKRELSNGITNPTIDGIYEKARAAGALGGKLLGAGSSGFMVFFVPPVHHHSVIEALSGYLHVPFRFEYGGTTLLYNDSVGVKGVLENGADNYREVALAEAPR